MIFVGRFGGRTPPQLRKHLLKQSFPRTEADGENDAVFRVRRAGLWFSLSALVGAGVSFFGGVPFVSFRREAKARTTLV